MMLVSGVCLPGVGVYDDDGTIFVRQSHKDVWELLKGQVMCDGGKPGVIIKGPVGVGKV